MPTRLYAILGDAAVGRFSDGGVSDTNENVRGGDIFIIQSTYCPNQRQPDELVVMVDALRLLPQVVHHRRYPPTLAMRVRDRRVRSAVLLDYPQRSCR